MSTAEPTISTLNYVFRKYIYTKFSATIGTSSVKNYIDSGYPISIIDRKVLLDAYPNIRIRQIFVFISVRGIGNLIY